MQRGSARRVARIAGAAASPASPALDMPVLASLLFQNTPTGRPLEPICRPSVFEDLPPTLDVDTMDKGGSFVTSDAFGKVYARRRLLGIVPVEREGSAKFRLPGGLPIVLALPETPLSKKLGLPRYQRESMVFSRGEYAEPVLP